MAYATTTISSVPFWPGAATAVASAQHWQPPMWTSDPSLSLSLSSS